LTLDFNVILGVANVALAFAAIISGRDIWFWLERKRRPLYVFCMPGTPSWNGLSKVWDVQISFSKNLALNNPIFCFATGGSKITRVDVVTTVGCGLRYSQNLNADGLLRIEFDFIAEGCILCLRLICALPKRIDFFAKDFSITPQISEYRPSGGLLAISMLEVAQVRIMLFC
jgi:hypothetical protein